MTKQINPMVIQKDTAPYLYLTDYSGIYLNDFNASTINRGIEINVNEQLSSTFYLVSFQIWVRYPKKTFDSTIKLFSIVTNSSTIDYVCTPTVDNSRARITSTEPSDFFKNGNQCSSLILRSQEWASIYVVFQTPLSLDNFNGKIILHPNFVFNNISQYTYENEIGTITTTINLHWERVLKPTSTTTNTWGAIDGSSWQDSLVFYDVQSDYILSGDYIYGNQVGTSVIVNDDLATIQTHANGADIFTNVEWQKIEKSLV